MTARPTYNITFATVAAVMLGYAGLIAWNDRIEAQRNDRKGRGR